MTQDPSKASNVIQSSQVDTVVSSMVTIGQKSEKHGSNEKNSQGTIEEEPYRRKKKHEILVKRKPETFIKINMNPTHYPFDQIRRQSYVRSLMNM